MLFVGVLYEICGPLFYVLKNGVVPEHVRSYKNVYDIIGTKFAVFNHFNFQLGATINYLNMRTSSMCYLIWISYIILIFC